MFWKSFWPRNWFWIDFWITFSANLLVFLFLSIYKYSPFSALSLMSLNKLTQDISTKNSFRNSTKSNLNPRHRVYRNNSNLTEKSDTIVSITPTNSFGQCDTKFKPDRYTHDLYKARVKNSSKHLQKSVSNASNSSNESDNSKKRNKIKKSNTTSLYDLMYVDGRRISSDRGRLATKYTLVF